ncbi:hypothetical protein [Mastigocoleus sp. MO_188.B34]|uniref:hypothetical protein n=1 Tax=Mastigocoleus sp. MO_188.B34 TaxID=3036635 RepID=UPI002639CAB7|nr:hypothetical protein [Mastigocoleus sp. MO_188.B34]MDJ0696251.1 hypothetical protein [Mastigocoleus sp. MO_188.B34]
MSQKSGVRTDRALTSVNAVGRQHSRSQESGVRGSNQLPITNYQSPITNYQLPITHY